MKTDLTFPYYQELNDYLRSFSKLNAHNPLFFCLKISPANQVKTFYKPPFRKAFYSIVLTTNAKNSSSYFDVIKTNIPNSYLALQSPGLLNSYLHDENGQTEGYAVYFKSECFSFLKNNFETEFPIFNFLNTNFMELPDGAFENLRPYFEEFFMASKQKGANQQQITILKLLILLYALKEYLQYHHQPEEQPIENEDSLFQKYLQLISQYYVEKRTVKEYASLLSISPNYLSQIIKKRTNKKALSFINEKMINEAKSSILHSNHNIGEIAKRLNFSDTSNFVKFFKSKTGKTPMEYKKQRTAKMIDNSMQPILEEPVYHSV